MIRNICYIAGLMFLLFSCQPEKDKYLSDPDKWAPVVADMQIIQTMLENAKTEVKDSLSRLYVEQLLVIHGISKEDLKGLKIALTENPAATGDFYEKVTLHLQNIEAEYEKRDHNQIEDPLKER